MSYLIAAPEAMAAAATDLTRVASAITSANAAAAATTTQTLAAGADEVSAAIASAHPAVETLHSRLSPGLSSPRYALLADMLSNAGLIVGEAISGWQSVDFANILIELVINNWTVRRHRGGLPSGDPLGAVVALANHLQRHGQSLLPYQFVTTGSYTGVHLTNPGDRIMVRFGGCPELRIPFD